MNKNIKNTINNLLIKLSFINDFNILLKFLNVLLK